MTEEKSKAIFCLSGSISKLPPISNCMDGATHLIHTFSKILPDVRLKASNNEVLKKLEEFNDVKMSITVCGYIVKGPECSYMNVIYINPTHEFERLVLDE